MAHYPADTFQEATEIAIEASNQLHGVINGDANAEVTVEDGSKIPSVRKAMVDSLYFKPPIAWAQGEYEDTYNQLREFVDGDVRTWWFAKGATVSTPVLMTTNPAADPNWTLWSAVTLNAATYETQKRLAAEAGLNMVGSFLLGGTVTNVGDVVFCETDGKYYGWGGTLPKTVPAGTTPETSGGIGAGAWVDRTDVALRGELLSSVLTTREDAFSLRDIISVADYGAIADYDIATKAINSNSTWAFKQAISAAKAVNGTVYIPAAPRGKAYYINETIYPYEFSGMGTNPSGYYGPMLVGENRHGAYLVFDLNQNEIGIHIYGTSGGPSNLGYKNLTIRPHASGVGIGVCEQGPCVITAENFDIQDFDINLKLSNGTEAGIFTEFGTHRRGWLKNGVTADLQFRRDGGDASFHGANFEHIIINTKYGSIGVDIGTGCNVYNSAWHMNLFGETGATFILNNGARSGDDRVYFEGTAAVINNGSWSTSGHWRVENATGVLADASTKPFCISSYISPQSPADTNLTGLGFSTIEATKPLSNGDPSNDLLRLRGSNAEGLAFAGYGGGTFERQGIAICSWAYGDLIKDIKVRSFWHLNGITSFQPSFKLQYSGQSGTQLSINSTGFHTGQQGKTASVTINPMGAVSQTVYVPGSHMPVAGQQTLVSLRLSAPSAAHDTSYLYAVAANPYDSSSAATLISSNAFVTGSGFVAPSSVQVNSSGLFQFNVTTSLNLTASLNIVGIGVY